MIAGALLVALTSTETRAAGLAVGTPPTVHQNPAAEAPEASVERLDVRLVVYRGGEQRPDGGQVDPEGSYVEAVAEYVLASPSLAHQELVLLDFTRAIPSEPTELDEIALEGYLPGPWDPAALRVLGAWGAHSVERTTDGNSLRLALREGVTRVTLRYGVDVPHRYWPFGCERRRCSLSGAIAPLPSVEVTPARASANRSSLDGPSSLSQRVVAPAAWHVDAAFAYAGAAQRREQELVVVGAEQVTPYPSVFWGPKWYRASRHFHGATIEVLHERPRPVFQHPNELKLSLRRDIAGRAIALATEWIRVFEAVKRPLRVGEHVTIVEGPLRTAVAQYHPDVVVVSDQAFDLFPGKRLSRFHAEALARAGLDMLAERVFRGRHGAQTDVWLSGMAGFAMLQIWRVLENSPDEYAADILRNLTFVPAVDRFLYTQQASFAQTYFRGVEDPMPLRNHPLFFGHELPTGRRIHEKLLDTLGPERMDAFYRRMFEHPQAQPQAVAESIYGHELGWFFEQWLGPYPSVDYRIADVRSVREGAGWRHDIVVERVGEHGVIEPVQVLAVEKGGAQHFLVWNGALAAAPQSLADEPAVGRHTFVLRTPRKLDHVRLDPRGRLLQEPQPDDPNIDPLFNDRTPPSFRFLYTGAQLSVAFAEIAAANTAAAAMNAITGYAAFEGSLRRDLRRSGSVLVARDRETHVSLGLSVSFAFGERVNRQRRRARVRLAQTTSWLNARSLDPRGGLRLIERISISDDTRRFGWWPEIGRGLSAGLSARHVLRVDAGPKDHRHDFLLDAQWDQLWRVAKGHVFATSLRGEAVFPVASEPEFRALSRVGGIGGLSGYGGDEIFGLASIISQIEYRHLLLADLNFNLLNLVFLRGIGGVAFAGAATVSGCGGYGGLFRRESWYGNVGYGLTAHTFILGITPQLLRVDVSVPLVRRQTMCLGEELPEYLAEVQGSDNAARLLPPLSVNVLFSQTF